MPLADSIEGILPDEPTDTELLRQARNPRCPSIREPQSLELEKLLSDRALLMHQLNENERQIMQIVHDFNWRKI